MSQWTPPTIGEVEPPAPLIVAEVDLRDFPFMPMFVWRVLDSEFIREATREEIGCAFLLWCAAWREKPAGSLPNDDKMLSHTCKLASHWKQVERFLALKRMALWGFILCNDGRFYHPVICEQAKKAWEAKEKQRVRSRLGNEARWGEGSRKDSPKESPKDPKGQGQGHRDSSLRSESYASSLCSDATRGREKKPEKSSPMEILKTVLSEETALDVIAHRKAKRAPLTPRAAELLVAAFRDHGDPERAAAAMIANGWQGFRPEWMHANRPRDGPQGRSDGSRGFLLAVQADIERDRIDRQRDKRGCEESASKTVPLLDGPRRRKRTQS